MRKVVIALITLVVFSLSLALPALAGPLSHKAVFVLDEAKYTVDGVTKSMDAKTFATNSRTYVPVRYLAYACGVSEKNVGYADGQVTLALDNITVKVWVNKKDLKINNEPVTMDVSVLAQGGRTYLPARWVAEAFGYKVDWVPAQQAVLVYPPGGDAPAVPVDDPITAVKEYKADGNLVDKYPDVVNDGRALREADYMAVDLDELPAKVGISTIYKVWRDPNDQEDCWAGVYHILVEQSNPDGIPVHLYFIKDGKIKEVSNNATNDAGLTHWTQSHKAHLNTLLTAEEIWIDMVDVHGNDHILVVPNPAKGGQ